jgi:hypothetical protein
MMADVDDTSAAAAAGSVKFDPAAVFPAEFLEQVDAILGAVEPFGKSLEHLVQGLRLSREWRNKRTKDVDEELDEYFAKVMWSKSDAFVRLDQAFSYDFGATPAAALPPGGIGTTSEDGLSQLLNYDTGGSKPAILRFSGGGNSDEAGGGAAADSSDADAATAAAAVDGDEPRVEDADAAAAVALVDEEDRVRAVPVRTGIALQFTATLDFEENMDPDAVAAREKVARKQNK